MGNNKQFTDHELITLLQEDELLAFKEIYKQYWYKLYVVAYKRLRSKESSEEIVQNLFTKFWINRKEIRITKTLGAYLFTSIRYAVIDYLEKEATKKNYISFTYDTDLSIDNGTEEKINLHDLEIVIEREIIKLPSRCRSVFELSRKKYLSNKEIAAILEISEKTVECHITNALRSIKLGLSK